MSERYIGIVGTVLTGFYMHLYLFNACIITNMRLSTTISRRLPGGSGKRVGNKDVPKVFIDVVATSGVTLQFAKAALQQF